MKSHLPAISILVLLVATLATTLPVISGPPPAASRQTPKLPKRAPWLTSRVQGTPEPPPPYRTVPLFPKLRFRNPVLIATAPGTDRLFVAEQGGKIFSFTPRPDVAAAELFLDLPKEIQSLDPAGKAQGVGELYGLAFHPQFEKNRLCYVCYTLGSKTPGEQLPDGTRLSRFRVTEGDLPRIDPQSETVLLAWLGGGHNGGCLEFGPDGYLYVSSGDGSFPNPPDARLAGQDVSNLLSAILRIDVDREQEGRPYAIPADNPFVSLPNARGEIWAYGFRNPWKITFDRQTGELWAGDVGWELWELVHRIRRGGNYGWSIMEGNQPVRPAGERGPTPILPPAIEIPHSEGASVTGGYVYRGKKLPELVGTYIFGDWETRRMWAARFDETRVTSREELVEPTLRIVAFGEDRDGELFILDYDDGTIHTLERNAAPADSPPFPQRLSETGIFASTPQQKLAAGVIPFSINASQWTDFATAERLVALPGESTIKQHPAPVPVLGTIFNRTLEFPADAVLVRTLAIERERGKPETLERIETQLLHYNGRHWRGYSYRWNEAQTDAELVPAEGAERTLSVRDADSPGGTRQQTWSFPGRAACARCHNPWAQHTLAFNLPQLKRQHNYGGIVADQLPALRSMGVLTEAEPPTGQSASAASDGAIQALVHLNDSHASLDARARSYLHVNCAHCHQNGAGGTADIELRAHLPLEQTKAIGVRPMQGGFGMADAQIIAAGDPYRSVLFYRMAKLGRGRMPHVGSEVIDEAGLRLIHDWIRQLPIHASDEALVDKLRALDDPPTGSAGRKPAEAAQDGVEERVKARKQTIDGLLASTTGALVLSRAVAGRGFSAGVRGEVLEAAVAHPDIQVRDLFETFLPPERRAKRLGSVIRPDDILKLQGDATRGKELFFSATGVQCRSCHAVAGTGSKLGPELTRIGEKQKRAQLLESILEPSKLIDPKYVTQVVETRQGRVVAGLLVERTPQEVVLRDSRDELIRIPAADVEQIAPQRESLMPELLLRDLTAAQVADLLAFLESLK